MSIDRRIVAAALKKVALILAELMNPCASEFSHGRSAAVAPWPPRLPGRLPREAIVPWGYRPGHREEQSQASQNRHVAEKQGIGRKSQFPERQGGHPWSLTKAP
jgi:hypothetical protein